MIKVGIVGATGMVGQRFVDLLRDHPWFETTTFTTSERNVGKRYEEAVNWFFDSDIPDNARDIVCKPTTVNSFEDVDLVFSAIPGNVASTLEFEIAGSGIPVFSNVGVNRMEEDVPLVVPEINSDHLQLIDRQKEERGIDGYVVTNPNCSTIILTLALKPLMDFGLKKVTVATMQSISGAGYAGVPSMVILDNIVPYISNEEDKVETEPQKILGTLKDGKIDHAKIDISATCTRVPVIYGHTMSAWAEMERDVTLEDLKDAFINFKQPLSSPSAPDTVVRVMDDPFRPQPRLDANRGNGMTVSVGRLTKLEKTLRFVVTGHNTIRGASGASILNAEFLKVQGDL